MSHRNPHARRVAAVLAATVALLAAPAAAHAFTFVQYSGTTGLSLAGDANGSELGVDIRNPSGTGDEYVVSGADPNSFFPIGGCARSGDGAVLECPITGARSMTATLGGGADLLDLGGNIGPATISGGDGDDRMGGSSVTSPMTLDGGSGDDFMIGGSAADTFTGGEGNDNMHLNAGADNANGGNGNDQFLVIG